MDGAPFHQDRRNAGHFHFIAFSNRAPHPFNRKPDGLERKHPQRGEAML